MPKLTNAGETKQSEDPEFKNNENGHMHTCLEGWQFNNDQVKLLTVLKISLENMFLQGQIWHKKAHSN